MNNKLPKEIDRGLTDEQRSAREFMQTTQKKHKAKRIGESVFQLGGLTLVKTSGTSARWVKDGTIIDPKEEKRRWVERRKNEYN